MYACCCRFEIQKCFNLVYPLTVYPLTVLSTVWPTGVSASARSPLSTRAIRRPSERHEQQVLDACPTSLASDKLQVIYVRENDEEIRHFVFVKERRTRLPLCLLKKTLCRRCVVSLKKTFVQEVCGRFQPFMSAQTNPQPDPQT